MAKEKIVDAARRVAGPVIVDMGYELVDVQFVMEGGRWHLRFFIDKPGGVGISDCEAVSREIDTLIEVEDFITGPYALEVSSPGLDRPLFKPADYARFTGRLAKVRTKEKIDNQKVFSGRIDSPGDAGFDIVTSNGKIYHIEYGQVETARLEVEF
ncbi:MAG TPA: ribosome maturation factor RimP [Nitrospirota bacterium]|nr:ribosome maturation factor RimP [Nitrospirota bacterium]